jgi:formyl-CoA transferase/CoA:oxalate CoA-transferase
MDSDSLEDVTIVDFTQALAGPYGSGLLSMAGANVIRVEPPGGGSQRNFLRNSIFPNVEQYKRSIVIDLKKEAATDIVRKLVEDADAVVHSYPADTAKRLGVNYETMVEYNEDILVCSVTGFGHDEKYRNRLCFDPIAQAMSGLMANTGEPDRKPSRVGGSTLDYGAGVFAALGILIALRHREKHGEGQAIEVSLYDTAVAYMGYWYTYYETYGEMPQRLGHAYSLVAPYELFETKTEPVYVAVGSGYDKQWQYFCETFDKEEWIDDPRFESDEARIENRAVLHDLIEAEFRNFTREEIISRLEGNVAVGELRDVAEVLEEDFDFLEERGSFKRVTNPEADGRETVATGLPVQFSKEVDRSGKILVDAGENTVETLREAGFSDGEIQQLEADQVVYSHSS